MDRTFRIYFTCLENLENQEEQFSLFLLRKIIHPKVSALREPSNSVIEGNLGICGLFQFDFQHL